MQKSCVTSKTGGGSLEIFVVACVFQQEFYREFWLFGKNETRSPMRGVGMRGPRKKIPFQAPDFPWRRITKGVPPERAISTRYFGSRVPSSIDGSVRATVTARKASVTARKAYPYP